MHTEHEDASCPSFKRLTPNPTSSIADIKPADLNSQNLHQADQSTNKIEASSEGLSVDTAAAVQTKGRSVKNISHQDQEESKNCVASHKSTAQSKGLMS